MEGISSLPNELLIHILSSFSTQLLLPFTAVSRRFHDLILRIIHHRLLLAAALTDHKLILECYHPSSKNTEPYLFCDYLGTPGLSSEKDGEGTAYEHGEGTAYEHSRSIGRLGILGGLYSRFRPIRPEAERRLFRPHPAGDPLGQQGVGASLPEVAPEIEGVPEALVAHTVNLDSHELFSQLMVVTNLVRLGPRRGVFYSFVNIADGVVRIWREWLAERARSNKTSSGNGLAGDIVKEVFIAENVDNNDIASRTLWVGNRKDVGIRVKIQEKTWRQNAPLLLLRDEDPAVSYSMGYEVLLIRTTHLLLAVEKALMEQYNSTGGKAMIFGSFVEGSIRNA